MKSFAKVIIIIVGLINFFPIVGLVSAQMLSQLYGGVALDGDLLILMRHRALLFGILGGFIIFSAFRPVLQPAAIVMGLVSMLGFTALVLGAGDYGEKLYRVAIIDIFASAGMILVAILRKRKPSDEA